VKPALVVGPRFWSYPRDRWEPKYRWVPYRGADEYGRLTIVVPIPFGGYLVWAFWTCRCAECDDERAQTAEAQEDERREGPFCRDPECVERTLDDSGLCEEHRKEVKQ